MRYKKRKAVRWKNEREGGYKKGLKGREGEGEVRERERVKNRVKEKRRERW